MSRRDWVLRKSAEWLPNNPQLGLNHNNCTNRQCGISSLYADDEGGLSYRKLHNSLNNWSWQEFDKSISDLVMCVWVKHCESFHLLWVCSPNGRGNTFRAYVVWVRLPPYLPILWVNLRGKESGHRKTLVKLLTHVAIKTQVLNRLPVTWLVGSSPTTYTILDCSMSGNGIPPLEITSVNSKRGRCSL